MPQSLIKINAVIGSDTDLPINTLIQLDNQNIGGEVSYKWSILDQPAGAADSLSSTTIQNPTFTPKKEGTYLIKLIVNEGLPDEDTDTVVAGILQLKIRERIPAAGETTEADVSRGWAVDTNNFLRFIDDSLATPSTAVGANSHSGTLARGTVVRVTSGQVIKSGLPGQETVPGFVPAPATAGANVDELLAVIESGVDGSDPVAIGALCFARIIGRIAALPLGAGAVGDPVYVSDAAAISTTPGTNLRQVGSIMAVSGVNRDIWFSGTQGGDTAPVDRAYLIYGPPGSLTNAKRVDGLNADGALGAVPYTFRAGDVGTVPLVAKRFSNLGADPFQVHDETGSSLFQIDALGNVNQIGGDSNFRLLISGTDVFLESAADAWLRYDRTGEDWYIRANGNDLMFIGELSATQPAIFWDPGATGDRLSYDRTGNIFVFQIGATDVLKVRTTGLYGRGLRIASTDAAPPSTHGIIEGGLNVGFLTTPTAATVGIGDATFLLDYNGGDPRIQMDSDGWLEFDRSADVLFFHLAGSDEMRLSVNILAPETTLGLSLGSSSRRWNDAFIDRAVCTKLTGDAVTPSTATALVARTAQNAIVARATITTNSTTPTITDTSNHWNVASVSRTVAGLYQVTFDVAVDVDDTVAVNLAHSGTPMIVATGAITGTTTMDILFRRTDTGAQVDPANGLKVGLSIIGRPNGAP